jgi:hypothetical protein
MEYLPFICVLSFLSFRPTDFFSNLDELTPLIRISEGLLHDITMELSGLESVALETALC